MIGIPNAQFLPPRTPNWSKVVRLLELSQQLQGQTFTSPDRLENNYKNALRCLMDRLNTLRHWWKRLNHMFSLEKACIVMLLCNFDPENEHENGTGYVVDTMTINVLFLSIAKWTAKLSKWLCNQSVAEWWRHTFYTALQTLQSRISTRFATKTNSTQGNLFEERLGIYFCKDWLDLGELYVAIWTAPHSSNTVVHSEDEDRIMKNIVHPEVLSTNLVHFQGIL